MFEYKFTDVGEGLHEGVVAQIYVKVGDTIKEGDPMFSVETDKVTTDLPAPQGGVVTSILASVGQTVHVGEVMLILNDDGSAPAAAPAASHAAPAPAAPAFGFPSAAPAPAAAPAFSFPSAPAAAPAPAADSGESGGGGASVVGEVKVSNTLFGLFGDQGGSSSSTPAFSTPTPAPATPSFAATPLAQAVASDLNVNLANVTPANGAKVFSSDVFASAGSSAPASANANETYQEITSVRKAIAKAMTTANDEIPTTVLTFNFDVTKLVAYRKQVKDAVLANHQVKLSFLPFLLKAITKTIASYPIFNSQYDKTNNRLVLKKNVNLGIAVDTADGLMVPNIKAAQDKSIIEIAKEVTTLAEKARSKKLGLADLSEGTISVTNFGSIGALFGTPIIKFPEVAIIATGTVEERLSRTPDNQILVKQIMPITIAADHRWIDGADIGRFAKTLREIIENLDGLLI
ncbi:dihydrolipoamide acetyltransferase family protein [Mycoplasma bradburyae]|uniref:Dihydrolipoamide acetyltransferase component of pyruvate dehydrogenase complex n=1 Tax=Mycoplasma bradburyae TaxID=2963128 RepID=A0AAW6HSD0_9MOLU|nr:dihydrolipoamide acetyltransferase family protein [Mycoplasma bradburyae]MDC4183509.1 2-oxo acid dehydrogenase subunit E2 [Mycoplasma bradburyae]